MNSQKGFEFVAVVLVAQLSVGKRGALELEDAVAKLREAEFGEGGAEGRVIPLVSADDESPGFEL